MDTVVLCRSYARQVGSTIPHSNAERQYELSKLISWAHNQSPACRLYRSVPERMGNVHLRRLGAKNEQMSGLAISAVMAFANHGHTDTLQ